jgi:hypothetical protein
MLAFSPPKTKGMLRRSSSLSIRQAGQWSCFVASSPRLCARRRWGADVQATLAPEQPGILLPMQRGPTRSTWQPARASASGPRWAPAARAMPGPRPPLAEPHAHRVFRPQDGRAPWRPRTKAEQRESRTVARQRAIQAARAFKVRRWGAGTWQPAAVARSPPLPPIRSNDGRGCSRHPRRVDASGPPRPRAGARHDAGDPGRRQLQPQVAAQVSRHREPRQRRHAQAPQQEHQCGDARELLAGEPAAGWQRGRRCRAPVSAARPRACLPAAGRRGVAPGCRRRCPSCQRR